jgi:catechol-2,3-dioxygenase
MGARWLKNNERIMRMEHTSLNVSDLARSVPFYRLMLGFE